MDKRVSGLAHPDKSFFFLCGIHAAILLNGSPGQLVAAIVLGMIRMTLYLDELHVVFLRLGQQDKP